MNRITTDVQAMSAISNPSLPDAAPSALSTLWHDAQLPDAALSRIELRGSAPGLPSSFAVGDAAQASLGASALAAAEIRHRRGHARQDLSLIHI